MAESSLHKSSTSLAVPHRRPNIKRVRHTWHGESGYRSHFEDFMREIGVDAKLTHLCCVPGQATRYSRSRSKSEPSKRATLNRAASTSSSVADRGRSRTRERGFRHPHDHPTKSQPKSKSSSSHPLSRSSIASSPPKRPAIASATLKTQAVTSVYMQNHSASSLYPSVSAGQNLRSLIGDNMSGRLTRPIPPQLSPVDQVQWTPLPTAPAIVPTPVPPKTTFAPPSSSVRSFSRVPSFASLDTASSSEGPETPRGHSPLPSSTHEPLSPSLSDLERTTRIRVPGSCVTCKKTGHNFPSCPTCGDAWCSRECRVQGNGGSKKHTCQRRMSGISILHAGMHGQVV